MDLKNSELNFCKPLVDVLLSSLNSKERFYNELNLTETVQDRIFAAISHPFFKLRWIPEGKREILKEIFTNAVVKESSKLPVQTTSRNTKNEFLDEDFFNFSTEAEVDISRENEIKL